MHTHYGGFSQHSVTTWQFLSNFRECVYCLRSISSSYFYSPKVSAKMTHRLAVAHYNCRVLPLKHENVVSYTQGCTRIKDWWPRKLASCNEDRKNENAARWRLVIKLAYIIVTSKLVFRESKSSRQCFGWFKFPSLYLSLHRPLLVA
jgi:hypothetical protein